MPAIKVPTFEAILKATSGGSFLVFFGFVEDKKLKIFQDFEKLLFYKHYR